MTGMTDTRRAVLWGVFSVSLVMLWDGWSKHNGQPSMFAPPPPAVTAPAQAGAAGVPAVAGAASAAVAGVAALPAATAGVPVSQKIDITTDLVQATFDTRGGSIVRMALPRYKDDQDAKNPVMLFDQSAGRVYQADSGLIPRMAGEAALPNHLTVMNLLPGPRTLADGQNELTLTFESPDQGGVKLRKSYTFKRGDYAVKVRHEVVNGTAAPIAPQLYLQLARDGTVPSSSMFMGPTAFTGPSIYTDKGKFQKVDFSDIEKGKADHEKSADNGWIAMVQHHFVGAWLVGDKRERSFQTKREGTNLYSTSMTLPLAPIAAGATQAVDATLYAGPQEEKKLEALAPGLELVKDYGWVTILAKPLFWLLDKLHGMLGNWGWSIVALVVLLKIAFYWLNAKAYASMAKMKAINPKVMEQREQVHHQQHAQHHPEVAEVGQPRAGKAGGLLLYTFGHSCTSRRRRFS